ncbi:MAG: catechol 2,3-dioxygenase-like lactoylglutathione lyase family enzyme [Chlamydiales bacterium]|jgi:catechol 2,3-dioxygenase-like lactoylglutathione lyase family enzyme
MERKMTTLHSPVAIAALAALLLIFGFREESANFASPSVDFGIVVSDIDAAARFYGESLGLSEAEGFEVGVDFCRAAGLTDEQPLSVRVFVLDDNGSGSKVKLMQLEGVESRPANNAFIHSQLGMSYMTLFVSDLDVVLRKLAKDGVKPLAAGPVKIGAEATAPSLAVVRDPDGNLIELIGPRS